MNNRKIFSLTAVFVFLFFINAYAAESAYKKNPQQPGNLFNTQNVYNHVKELSDNKYRGRLAGDSGNTMAENYIADYFKSIGLKPSGNNGTYFQKFDVYVPEVAGPCYFKVFDKNSKLVKEYKYGTDFKEAVFGSSVSGTVNGILKQDIDKEGAIYLSNSHAAGESTASYQNDEQLAESGIKAVIYPYSNRFRFRSPYKQQIPYNNGLVKIYAADDIISEITDYSSKKYTFEIKSTVTFKKVSVNNLIGIIEGTDKSLPPIILSAHFDHVGYDADGVIYNGAFDNASGTAVLLEAARVLKKSSPPKRSVIIAAFNAEEEGLLGSKYFVRHPTAVIKDAECVNFDMVGAPKAMPLSILSSTTRSAFSSEILEMAQNASINVNTLYEDNSDHAPFCFAGYSAVTLIHDDLSKIHTPLDTISNFNKDNLNEVFITVEKFLNSKGILNASSVPAASNWQNYKPYMPWAAVISAAVIILVIFSLKKENSD